MRLATRHRPPVRLATRLLLLLALIAASLTLTHCRMVGDRLTGVEANLLHRDRDRNECRERCRREYRDQIRAEERLHDENREACGQDYACRRAENERHEAAEDAIKAARRACLNACHDQGGGGSDR